VGNIIYSPSCGLTPRLAIDNLELPSEVAQRRGPAEAVVCLLHPSLVARSTPRAVPRTGACATRVGMWDQVCAKISVLGSRPTSTIRASSGSFASSATSGACASGGDAHAKRGRQHVAQRQGGDRLEPPRTPWRPSRAKASPPSTPLPATNDQRADPCQLQTAEPERRRSDPRRCSLDSTTSPGFATATSGRVYSRRASGPKKRPTLRAHVAPHRQAPWPRPGGHSASLTTASPAMANAL
jgi:hypothetical protein